MVSSSKGEHETTRAAIIGDAVFADPFALLAVIWRARLAVFAAFVVSGAVGVSYVLVAPSWYRAEATLLPVDHTVGSGGAALLGQLGGLAALAGVNLGGEASSEPLAVLKSREFARQAIQDFNLAPTLVALNSARKTGNANDIEESQELRDAVDLFDKRVRSVMERRESGLVVLRIEWIDPIVAADWANLLALRINQQLRERALSESQGRIEFLRKELASTQEVAVQQTIGSLLKSEMEKQMIARGNPEFAFRVIDKAEVPKTRTSPRRTLVVLGSALLGCLLVVLIVVAAAVMRGGLSPGLRSNRS